MYIYYMLMRGYCYIPTAIENCFEAEGHCFKTYGQEENKII